MIIRDEMLVYLESLRKLVQWLVCDAEERKKVRKGSRRIKRRRQPGVAEMLAAGGSKAGFTN